MAESSSCCEPPFHGTTAMASARSELTIAMLRAKNAGITGSENEDLPRIAPLTSRVIAMLHTGIPGTLLENT